MKKEFIIIMNFIIKNLNSDSKNSKNLKNDDKRIIWWIVPI